MGITEAKNEHELCTKLMERIIFVTGRSSRFKLLWECSTIGIYCATWKNICELTFVHTPDMFEMNITDKTFFHSPLILNPRMHHRHLESQFRQLEIAIKIQVERPSGLSRMVSKMEYLEYLVKSFS